MRRARVCCLLSAWTAVLAASCAPARSPATAVPATAMPTTAPGGAAPALRYAVTMGGRHAGDAEIRILPDGKRVAHLAYIDRGRGPDVHSELVLDAAGAPRWYRATGNDYLKAQVDEQLDDAGGALRWRSTSEHGDAPPGSGWYMPAAETPDKVALLARALLHAKDRRLPLLPAGEAWIEDDTAREVEVAGAKRQLRRIAIAGLGFSPSLVWLAASNYLIRLLSLGFLSAVTEARSMRYIVDRLSCDGAIAWSQIGQNPDVLLRRGEGLAEAFDVDAF